MARRPGSVNRSKVSTFGPCDSWAELDRRGLNRDHYYRRFVELKSERCPRCSHTGYDMTRILVNMVWGWEWSCHACRQRWREPKITPGLRIETKYIC